MTELVFWFVAIFTIVSALFVVLNNQLLYSAIALLFTLFGVAGLYIFLWADFIAGIQLLVYIGGILVLIIFGIMLTNRISSVRLSQTNIQQGVGGAVSIWLLIQLIDFNENDPESCLRAFKANKQAGLILASFLGIGTIYIKFYVQ